MLSELDWSFAGFFEANGLIFELLISVAMLTLGLTRRDRFEKRVTVSSLTLVAMSSVWGGLVPDGMWANMARFLLLIACSGFAIMMCWRVTARQAMFYLAAAAMMQHFAFRGASIVTVLVEYAAPNVTWSAMVVYPLALLPFFVVGYLLFARPINRHSTEEMRSGSVLMLLIAMLASVNVFTHLFDEFGTEHSISLAAVYFPLDLVTCAFLLALTTAIVQRQSAEHDSEILRHLLHQQKTQMEGSKETIDLINLKTHDLKKQIGRLGDRIPQDEIDELRALVSIYDAAARTGNETLDVLLAEKLLLCELRGIHFDRIVDGGLLGFMRPGDVYSLFGNALDNAMEAVANVADPAHRYIALRVRQRKGLIAVQVENAYLGERSFKNGLPVTTKSDTRYHGFGMRSVRMITDKYGGTMAVTAKDGVFTLTLLLPVAESQNTPMTNTV
ncbi:ATP-binding protein [Cryobacterium lactosi]|uniref:ATP-binding protein n=1 Tax=Cryobacterium lactosi TaxID=1259202 RepID=A0A4R9BG18_9MICO|nr:ATP-binding protein [Cryobacterium lactosi]TFD83526.1 ATP-binding protein [Cryobacterium lactosi]